MHETRNKRSSLAMHFGLINYCPTQYFQTHTHPRVYTGFRHISLRNELNQPQNLATVFVHLKVGDYVPDAFAGRYGVTNGF